MAKIHNVPRDTRADSDYFQMAAASAIKEMASSDKWAVEAKGWTRISTANEVFRTRLRLLLIKYSAGESVASLLPLLADAVFGWEVRERVEEEVALPDEADKLARRRSLSLNIDQYMSRLWLFSLGICLKADEALMDRIVMAIGHEGEDEVLDRLIATRYPERKIATELLHPAAYQPLLDAMKASSEEAPELLRQFTDKWYIKACRKAYWWNYTEHIDPVSPWYFGYWCIEAAGVVAAFGIDDSTLANNNYYPADFVRYFRDETA